MHKDDAEKFGGYSRVDLVDFAHGDGRMHNTLWNVGRRVIRAKCADIEKYALKIGEHPLKAGVKCLNVDVGLVTNDNGDVFVCSGMGHDFSRLTSHGSGELTTLLFNSVHNLAIGDVIYSCLLYTSRCV